MKPVYILTELLTSSDIRVFPLTSSYGLAHHRRAAAAAPRRCPMASPERHREMKRQRALAVTAAGALATTVALAFTASPASADPLELKADEARADLLGNVSPAMVQEMSETFDLTATEVYDRLAVESVAADLLAEVPAEFDK